MSKDNFKFYIDADIIKGNEEGEMRIRGIASDSSQDRQGEYLDPRTMDLSEFSQINWNHKGKDDPSAIIGMPDKSKVRVTENNELYVEGVLYNNVPMAKATYTLMNAMQKSNTGRKLGMSVEGMVLERDPNNPNKITKSKITGVAICPVPVNGSTWTELIQKGFTDESDPIYDSETILLEQELEKAISIESTTDSQENTGIDRKIEKESIDGATPKKKKKKVKKVIESDNDNVELSKAEVYEKIFNYFYINDLQKAKQIFNIVTKISQMDKKQITDETINKALSILDIANEVVTTNETEVNTTEMVEKSDEITLEKSEAPIIANDVEIEKAFGKKEAKTEEEEEDDKEEVGEKKDKKDKPKFKDEVYKAAKCEADEMKKENKSNDDIKKSLIDGGYSENLADVICADINVVASEASIQKSEIENLMKSQVNELSDIIKSYNTSLEGKINSFETIAKSSETKVEELVKSFDALVQENKTLQTRLENIEKTPMGSKSIISKSFVDRFENIKKGDEVYNLNLKKDRLALIEKSFDLGQAKGDEDLMQVAINLEATGQLTPRNITKLSTVGIHIA